MTIDITLIGGPFDGDVHVVRDGWPVPAAMLLPSPWRAHRYVVDAETMTATYDQSIDTEEIK